MVVFFSTAISVLYYLGAMQVVIRLVAVVMQKAMGTTAAESLNAAGNIFIGQVQYRHLVPAPVNRTSASVWLYKTQE